LYFNKNQANSNSKRKRNAAQIFNDFVLRQIPNEGGHNIRNACLVHVTVYHQCTLRWIKSVPMRISCHQ